MYCSGQSLVCPVPPRRAAPDTFSSMEETETGRSWKGGYVLPEQSGVKDMQVVVRTARPQIRQVITFDEEGAFVQQAEISLHDFSHAQTFLEIVTWESVAQTI